MAARPAPKHDFKRIQIPSTADGEKQHAMFHAPDSAKAAAAAFHASNTRPATDPA